MTSSIPSTTLDAVNEALEGERFAEEIYSKFYFESRSASYEELAAEARLAHTIAATALKEAIRRAGGSPSSKAPMTGPFAGDPRAAISGIDPLFLVDYLGASEHRNLKVYERLLARPELPDETKDALTDQIVARLANVAFRIARLAQTLREGRKEEVTTCIDVKTTESEQERASTA